MTARNLLVTSALPYANGSIHLGHMVEHIQTDIFVRYQRLRGHTCHYMCADDAHGTAIMLAAEKNGQTPEVYIAAIQAEHRRDFKGFAIAHDHYHSTHCPENKTLVEHVYAQAKAQGNVVDKPIKQLYCTQAGLFLADRFVKGTCPHCGAPDQYGDACEHCYATYDATDLIDPISVYSGAPPVIKESIHTFFKLTPFADRIDEWLQSGAVIPAVANTLKDWFKNGLKDWDISRDGPYFGFHIPGRPNHFFYVWLDAPLGYIATTQHWLAQQHPPVATLADIWESDTYEIHHFIGKDILYFHTLFWPALMLTAGYTLPHKVHVHGFLTINGEKMSKSRGTFILASAYLKHLNPDFLRYYYAAKLTENLDDIDLNRTDFTHKINADVLGKVVNIASRLGAILHKRCGGACTQIPDTGQSLLAAITEQATTIGTAYDRLHTQQACKHIMQLADQVNRYIDAHAPWALCKEDPDAAAAVCTTGINACRYLVIYLKPILPGITAGLETFFNGPPLTWDDLATTIENHALNPYRHVASRLNQDQVDLVFGAPS